jgi:hypothetical protein
MAAKATIEKLAEQNLGALAAGLRPFYAGATAH